MLACGNDAAPVVLGGAARQLLGEPLGELHEAGAGVGMGGQFEHGPRPR